MPCSRCEIAFHFRLKPTFMHGLWTTHFLVLIYIYMCMLYSREFTHRVKSVSMSKFTSQEVEALQNGGNQV